MVTVITEAWQKEFFDFRVGAKPVCLYPAPGGAKRNIIFSFARYLTGITAHTPVKINQECVLFIFFHCITVLPLEQINTFCYVKKYGMCPYFIFTLLLSYRGVFKQGDRK
jgi:hypothetical protein